MSDSLYHWLLYIWWEDAVFWFTLQKNLVKVLVEIQHKQQPINTFICFAWVWSLALKCYSPPEDGCSVVFYDPDYLVPYPPGRLPCLQWQGIPLKWWARQQTHPAAHCCRETGWVRGSTPSDSAEIRRGGAGPLLALPLQPGPSEQRTLWPLNTLTAYLLTPELVLMQKKSLLPLLLNSTTDLYILGQMSAGRTELVNKRKLILTKNYRNVTKTISPWI